MKLDEVNLGSEGRWRRGLKLEPWDLQPLGVGEMRRSQQKRLKGEAREVGENRPHRGGFYIRNCMIIFFFSGIRNKLSLQTNIYSFLCS